MFGKELFIRFTASAFRKLLSIYVFSYFPFGFECRMWDLILSVPDHCLSFHFIVWTKDFIPDCALRFPVRMYLLKEKGAFEPLVDKLSVGFDQVPDALITRPRCL